MNLTTLPRYLVGNREAIEQIVTSRGALLLGGLFVLSAGFAREYDGEDLLAEPYHVLLPLAASLATSLCLSLLLYAVAWMRVESPPRFGRFYRSFLALYWMTAPLAWLYAVPYERFLPAADAVRANLWTLSIVSIWRVLLITRASSVLLGGRFWAVLMPVMLFADTLALAALYFIPRPIVGAMGGVRLSDSEWAVRDFLFLVGFFSCMSYIVWLLGTVGVFSASRSWQPPVVPTERGRVSPALWVLAAAALGVWAIVLPRTQPEQRLRHRAERLLTTGQVAEGIAEMSRHQQADYPPHWSPPPHVGYGEANPPLTAVMTALGETPSAAWVQNVFVEKMLALFHDQDGIDHWYSDPDSDVFEHYLSALRQLPEGKQIAGELSDVIVGWPYYGRRNSKVHTAEERRKFATRLQGKARERFEALLEVAEQ